MAIIDFSEAFMTMPLHHSELQYNGAEIDAGIARNRPALASDEPLQGKIVVWRVLGFGGRPNPLVYARMASLALRTAQALFPSRVSSSDDLAGSDQLPRARMELYVDDTAQVLLGTAEQRAAGLDITLLWWLLLGLPIAWKKCCLHRPPHVGHTWIGVVFTVRRAPAVVMSLPPRFVQELFTDLEPFASTRGSVSLRVADRLAGRLGRVAQIVPTAAPFAGSFWAALSAARAAQGCSRGSQRPGRAAARRFSYAASWMRALLDTKDLDPEEPFFVLERVVCPSARLSSWLWTTYWVIVFDASVWGGGAALVDMRSSSVIEHLCFNWDDSICEIFGIRIGIPKHQAFWEACALFACLLTWGSRYREEGLRCLGDAIGALTVVLTHKGRGLLSHVAREIAWRKVRLRWKFRLGHVPSELNGIADALSRQFQPQPPALPEACLHSAQQPGPDWRSVWHALLWKG